MKVSVTQILLVILIVASVSPSGAFRMHEKLSISNAEPPDFNRAANIVKDAAEQPGNIDYDSFCAAERHEGANKLGCQIEVYKIVGLLVCLRSVVCEGQLQLELLALNTIHNANLTMVRFNGTIIGGLKCGKRGSMDVKCSGFLEEWIQPGQGEIKLVDGIIRKGKIDHLIRSVKGYQLPSGLNKTVDDLEKIISFMTSPGGCDDTCNLCNRICDLQGFFMKTGGFAIIDPEGVGENVGQEWQCYDPDRSPTTQQVLKGLREMVDALRA